MTGLSPELVKLIEDEVEKSPSVLSFHYRGKGVYIFKDSRGLVGLNNYDFGRYIHN